MITNIIRLTAALAFALTSVGAFAASLALLITAGIAPLTDAPDSFHHALRLLLSSAILLFVARVTIDLSTQLENAAPSTEQQGE